MPKTAGNLTLWDGTYLYSPYKGEPPENNPGDLITAQSWNQWKYMEPAWSGPGNTVEIPVTILPVYKLITINKAAC